MILVPLGISYDSFSVTRCQHYQGEHVVFYLDIFLLNARFGKLCCLSVRIRQTSFYFLVMNNFCCLPLQYKKRQKFKLIVFIPLLLFLIIRNKKASVEITCAYIFTFYFTDGIRFFMKYEI